MNVTKIMSSLGKNVMGKLPKRKPIFPMEKQTAECLLWMGVFTTPFLMGMCSSGGTYRQPYTQTENVIQKNDCNEQVKDTVAIDFQG